MILIILIHIYKFNFFVSFCYFMGGNIAYSFAIIPDHDTFSTIKNHDPNEKDWGAV